MKNLYICALLLFSYIGNAQDSIKVVGHGSMSDFNIASSQKNIILNFEFASLTEKSELTINILNLSEDSKINFLDCVLIESLNKKENTKIYTNIEQNQKDVIIKNILIGKYMNVYPIKAIANERINIFPFNAKHNTQNKVVPIILLMDNKENNVDVMETIRRILNCQQLEEIKKSDIEFLKNISNILNIITYEIKPL